MKVCVLGSGSRGNCTYIAGRRARVLIDLGFGLRSLQRRLQEAGLGETLPQAVFLTHGHRDHVAGVPSFFRSTPALLFCNQGALQDAAELEEVERREVFRTGEEVSLGDLRIQSFPVPHDAAEPVGFRVECEGIRGAVVTDLGRISSAVASQLARCDWVVLESNHDEELVKAGPYPWNLKQRLLGPTGHLSNGHLAAYLGRDFDGRASHLFLAHLSLQNNLPSIALETAREALRRRFPNQPSCCRLHLTDQAHPSIVIEL